MYDVHWILVVLRSVHCLFPRGVRDEFLSLARGTGSDLDMTRALGDYFIAC